mmetsp:Transcript_65349/g.151609  ORF Transcript_65349/g.151609 Transcript_65349/m.151609 type:complete len:201 (-) Transcript_65349:505-1107(-)
MEVPISNVSTDHATEAAALTVCLNLRHAFCQARHWDTNVTYKDSIASRVPTVLHGCKVASTPGLPKRIKLIAGSSEARLFRPATVPSSQRCNDVKITSKRVCVSTTQLHKQSRCAFKLCLEHCVGASDAICVQQFAPQQRRWICPHCIDDRAHGGVHVWEGQQAATAKRRLLTHADCHFTNHPQCSLTAKVELGQLVPRG